MYFLNVDGFWEDCKLKIAQVPFIPKSVPSTLFLSQVVAERVSSQDRSEIC